MNNRLTKAGKVIMTRWKVCCNK